MNDIRIIVEEIGMDDSISLGRCSRSTVYRWKRDVNNYLAANKYNWRVVADYKACTLTAVSHEAGCESV